VTIVSKLASGGAIFLSIAVTEEVSQTIAPGRLYMMLEMWNMRVERIVAAPPAMPGFARRPCSRDPDSELRGGLIARDGMQCQQCMIQVKEREREAGVWQWAARQRR